MQKTTVTETGEQQPLEVVVGYPQRPGFNMLAYQLVERCRLRFGLPGRFDPTERDCFCVSLAGRQLYCSSGDDPAQISFAEIDRLLGEVVPPIEPTQQKSACGGSKEVNDDEDYPDCFCSGE